MINAVDIIPNNWRMLQDEEIITDDCLCFGLLESRECGWGRPPAWLVGQAWCEGMSGHPKMIAKPNEETSTK